MSMIFFTSLPTAILSMYREGVLKNDPLVPTAATDTALCPPRAQVIFPSRGFTARSTAPPVLLPTCTPSYSAESALSAPITTWPSISMVDNTLYIASDAERYDLSSSPLPMYLLAYRAAASVRRTASIVRYRSMIPPKIHYDTII